MFGLKEGKTNMECSCGYRIYCQTPRMPSDSMWPHRQKRRNSGRSKNYKRSYLLLQGALLANCSYRT